MNELNIAFWIIGIVLLVGLWFMLAASFHEIGDLYYRIFKRAKDEVSRVDEDTEDNQNETSEVNKNA